MNRIFGDIYIHIRSICFFNFEVGFSFPVVKHFFFLFFSFFFKVHFFPGIIINIIFQGRWTKSGI